MFDGFFFFFITDYFASTVLQIIDTDQSRLGSLFPIGGSALKDVCIRLHLLLSFSLHRSDGVMRTVNTEKLLKTIPIIQNQMDVLLDFNVSAR